MSADNDKHNVHGEHDVSLGFIEKSEKWKLHSCQFPSKVGGKPSWLHLKDIPEPASLLCLNCGKPTIFLLQVYCPLLEEERDDCFHRIIYIFVCQDGSCYKNYKKGFIKAFRCQLARANEFYKYDPPPEGPCSSDCMTNCELKLCTVCGCMGEKRCSQCHTTSYCSKAHQVQDWKSGHKSRCGNKALQEDMKTSSILFEEYELVTEPENYHKPDVMKSEAENLEEYQSFINSDKSSSSCSGEDKLLEKMATSEDTIDKNFKKFKKRISDEPEQVIRYCLNGQELWVSTQNLPSLEDIPNCECGGRRRFEFQIMPQLLNYLKVDSMDDSMDWGTIAIYSCSQSCNVGPPYHPEFIWFQHYQ